MRDVRKRLIFHGKVQGVGFRYTVLYFANQLGLTGFVQNLKDTTVLAEVQGREDKIEELLKQLSRNSLVKITRIDEKEIPVRLSGRFYIK